LHERNFTLSDVYESDEAFVTGTFGGVVPVYEIDDHELELFPSDSIVKVLQANYNDLVEMENSI
jgi:branched-chain amino acid aminotransferase